MPTLPKPFNNFAQALRKIRKAKKIPQEAFALHSSRTYVSTLERGLKSPTLSKVDELAQVLDVHPLTLLILAYSGDSQSSNIDDVLRKVRGEIADMVPADIENLALVRDAPQM